MRSFLLKLPFYIDIVLVTKSLKFSVFFLAIVSISKIHQNALNRPKTAKF